MKRVKMIFVAAMTVLVMAGAARPAGAVSPDEVLKKTVDAYKRVNDYSFTVSMEGLDTFAKKQAAKMADANQSLADSAGVKVEEKKSTSSAPKLTYSKYNVKFMKPYVLQMQILRLDVAPDLVLEGKFTYNAATDPKVWWAKLKITPTPLKRSVKKDDASGFLTMGYAQYILDMQNFAANGKAKYLGTGKALGVDCHIIEYTFPKDVWGKFKPVKPNWADLKIPADIQHLITENLQDPKEKKYSSAKYWISTKDYMIVQVEKYIGGKFYWRESFAKIKTNYQKKGEFSPK